MHADVYVLVPQALIAFQKVIICVTAVYSFGSFIVNSLQTKFDCKICPPANIGKIVQNIVRNAVGTGGNGNAADIFKGQRLLHHGPYLFKRAIGVGVCLKVRDIQPLVPFHVHFRPDLFKLLCDRKCTVPRKFPAARRAVCAAANALCAVDIRAGKAAVEGYLHHLAAEPLFKVAALGSVALICVRIFKRALHKNTPMLHL